MIVWWHETVCDEPVDVLRQWTGKRSASFADMLAALRLETLQKSVSANCLTPELWPGVQKILDHLKTLVALAA